MAEASGTLRLHAQHGALVLDREVLRGPDGCLYEASDEGLIAGHDAARVFVFIPAPHAREAYLERLRRVDRIARYGWLTPVSVERDPKFGVAAVFRVARGRPLAGVPYEDLGGPEERIRIVGRLCHAVARGHDAEIYHGHIGPETIVLDGPFLPALLDAPVGSDEPIGAGRPGRAARDIRSLGELLQRLTPADAAGTETGRRLGAIVAKATAEEPGRRYPQVVRMGDELLAMLAKPAPSPGRRRAWASIAAAAALVGTGWAAFRAGEARNSAELDNAAGLLAALDFEIRDRDARIRQLEQTFSTQRRLVSTTQDFFWYTEDRIGVTPNTTLSFNAIELLGWPDLFHRAGYEDSALVADRLQMARDFVKTGYSRADGVHLDVILTELMVAVWELQAGEAGKAATSLERVVPGLSSRCVESDPLLRGANQLHDYARERAHGRRPVLGPDTEAWVVRLIADLPGAHRASAPGGMLDSMRVRFYDAVSLDRDSDFFRSVMSDKGFEGALTAPGS